MSFPSDKQLILLSWICVLLSGIVLAKAKEDWRPVSAEELQTYGTVGLDAVADVIFRKS